VDHALDHLAGILDQVDDTKQDLPVDLKGTHGWNRDCPFLRVDENSGLAPLQSTARLGL
jgi:hypothetical protein